MNGIEMSCAQGTKWCELLEKLPDRGRGALGVNVQGKTYSLNEQAVEYAYARILTYADEEGRRIYERSLQMLFLTAMHRLYPKERVRIQHSFGQGLYIDITGMIPDGEMLKRVEEEMQRLVEQDLPIRRRNVSTDDAKDYFEKTGQQDRLRILGYRTFKHFTLYEIDGCEDYF